MHSVFFLHVFIFCWIYFKLRVKEPRHPRIQCHYHHYRRQYHQLGCLHPPNLQDFLFQLRKLKPIFKKSLTMTGLTYSVSVNTNRNVNKPSFLITRSGRVQSLGMYRNIVEQNTLVTISTSGRYGQ